MFVSSFSFPGHGLAMAGTQLPSEGVSGGFLASILVSCHNPSGNRTAPKIRTTLTVSSSFHLLCAMSIFSANSGEALNFKYIRRKFGSTAAASRSLSLSPS